MEGENKALMSSEMSICNGEKGCNSVSPCASPGRVP